MFITSRVALPILVAVAILCSGCTNAFFQPSRQLYVDLNTLPLQPQELHFKSRDGTALTGWLFRAPGDDKRPLIIQFHGNAENMSSHFRSVYWLIEQEFDLMTFDYRGYGASAGIATAEGIVEDGEAALQEAIRLTEGRPRQVIVYGQSIGGNLALRAVSRLPDRRVLKAVVIESSFWSYQEMASSVLASQWWSWPLQWLGCLLVSDNYDPSPMQEQSDNAVPFLVLHGNNDPIIPLQQGKLMYERLPTPKCFWEISSNSHTNNMQVNKGEWQPRLIDFLGTGKCEDHLLSD